MAFSKKEQRDALRRASGQSSEPVWSLIELKRALTALQKCPQLRMFAIIDGLDEFEGSPSELAAFIKALSPQTFKLVAAGRPLAEHLAAFKTFPQLRLHEKTHDDICAYVTDRFSSAKWSIQAHERKDISARILRDAQGVFRWVAIVVDSLLEGISFGEDIKSLLGRLEDMPKNLFDLYMHLIRHKVEPRHQKLVASMLLIRASLDQINSFIGDYYLDPDEGLEDADFFTLALIADPNDLEWMVTDLDWNAIKKTSRSIENVVQYQCRQLLEIDVHDRRNVVVMHKTIGDFLRSERVRRVLLEMAQTDAVWLEKTFMAKSRAILRDDDDSPSPSMRRWNGHLKLGSVIHVFGLDLHSLDPTWTVRLVQSLSTLPAASAQNFYPFTFDSLDMYLTSSFNKGLGKPSQLLRVLATGANPKLLHEAWKIRSLSSLDAEERSEVCLYALLASLQSAPKTMASTFELHFNAIFRGSNVPDDHIWANLMLIMSAKTLFEVIEAPFGRFAWSERAWQVNMPSVVHAITTLLQQDPATSGINDSYLMICPDAFNKRLVEVSGTPLGIVRELVRWLDNRPGYGPFTRKILVNLQVIIGHLEACGAKDDWGSDFGSAKISDTTFVRWFRRLFQYAARQAASNGVMEPVLPEEMEECITYLDADSSDEDEAAAPLYVSLRRSTCSEDQRPQLRCTKS